MNEELLQFIWQNRLFDKDSLVTHTGEKIEVIHVGSRSNNSGPDFINTRIKVGETVWAGNTEIHIQASDWFKHGHNEDKAFDNVILHVVKKNNAVIRRSNGEEIPTLELHYNTFYETKYEELKSSRNWIPCQKDFHIHDEFQFNSWLERLCIERLEQKSTRIQNLLSFYKNDWEESFYCAIATNLGYKINAQPFEMLAKSIPLNTLLRHKDNLLQIEALLFGQAGFLSASLFDDAYFNSLKKEYIFLRKKYDLKPMEIHLWQFMRLRPAGFPTVRIAQLASLIFRSNNLFSKIIETNDLQRLRAVFRVEPSTYWITHYQFNKQGVSQVKLLGSDTIDSIIINTVIPFLFCHGIKHGNQKCKDRAVEFLAQIDAEQNSIIKEWENLGVRPKDAMSTQSLLQLKNEYCNRHKCLSCQVGMWILGKKT
jgi:hypothetical protein